MRYYLLALFFLITSTTNSQNSGEYPLEIPILLSGTFGELRPNHFHAGIDIKTQGREGFKVYSIGDGYVSRIQITHGGYGKALYIKHDNGQSSVYAHLQKFSPKIQKIVKEIQYSKESYTFRIYPSKDEVRISEKELIGFTGNTGGSDGPHLHYELRDEKDRPVNPFNFKNYTVKDTIPPVFLGLYYKNLSEQSNFKEIKTKKINNNLFISDTLYADESIGFGINSYDRMNNTWNKMGLTNIKANIDGNKVFNMNLNSFSYDEWRHINTFIDYASYKNKKIKIQKLYIEDYNPLSMYDRTLGNGIINVEESIKGSLYNIKLYDYNQNYTEILIPIKWKKKVNSYDEKYSIQNQYLINTDSLYHFNFQNSSLKIEQNTFYKNINIQINEKGELLFIDKDSIPLLKGITIKFNVNRYKDSIVKKAYIAKIEEENKSSFISSNLKNDEIIAKISNLGTYKIKIDSISPNVRIIGLIDNQWISKRKKLEIKINDSESGIKSYRGTINDDWILLEYNPSKSILTYDFNDRVNSKNQKNKLRIEISDNVGNTKVLNKVFFREIKK